MVINEARAIEGDATAFAWRRIQLFCNPEFTCENLVKLHSVPPRHVKNADRQAREIRYSLLQAQEYFNSAKSATLVTRPVLLYYATMNLALAEILFKNTADHRLAKLREHHAAHGLSIGIDGAIDRTVPTKNILQRLRATPQFKSGDVAYGTFEKWRQGVREIPVVGKTEESYGEMASTGATCHFFGADVPPSPTPSKGHTLLDTLSALPTIRHSLEHLHIPLEAARATITSRIDKKRNSGTLSLIFHPIAKETLDQVLDKIVVSPDAINSLTANEMPSGVGLRFSLTDGTVGGYLSLPPSVQTEVAALHFLGNSWNIGEFGAIYVALHIAGNLARYFPDLWMPHVEHSTAFSLLIHEICECAVERLPILIAGELDRCLYLKKN